MHADSHSPWSWIDSDLDDLRQRDLLRQRWSHAGPQGPTLCVEGRTVVNFGANDYLGLAADPCVREAAAAALDRYGWGAGASPLVTGRTEAHAALEAALAEFEQVPSALLFPTGFAANQGAIAALVGPGDAVISDALNHASLIEGCRAARATVHVYTHADCAAAERALHAARSARRRLLATDGLFSMDGDLAPLAELADLAQRHDAMLLVDEAHATGVLGDHGRGACELAGLHGAAFARVGTLSKALGSLGGFVSGSTALCDYLANRARTYVFSTAFPAAAAAAGLAALKIVQTEPQRRARLLELAAQLRAALAEQGWDVGASQSQIIPVIVGEPARALVLAAALRERGLFVPAIRPPSVPDGSARLRVSLSSLHTREHIDRLIGEMRALRA